MTDTDTRLRFWRDSIDQIDASLVDLLARRGRIVQDIQRFKRNLGTSARDASREAQQISRIVQASLHGPYSDDCVRKVFEVLFAHARETLDD